MHWLQENLKQINFKQKGFTKLSTIMVAMLLTLMALTLSNGPQSSIAYAQEQTCTPSLHRLLQDGQQLAIAPSIIQEFVDDTPIADQSLSRRIDQVVTEEGFASIPLSANLAVGQRLPNLRSAGFVFRRIFQPTYTIWRVRNQSSASKVVTVRSESRRVFDFRRFRFVTIPSSFSKTVTIPPYSDGFVRSDETSFFSSHELLLSNTVIDRERNRFTLYSDSRTIETGNTRPLFEVLQQTGLVTIPNDELPAGINLTAVGIFDGEPQRTVWKISNGNNTAQEVTLQALDSDDQRTVILETNSDTYVVSEEDGCIDNPNTEAQEALWVAESEGLLKVLTASGDIAFELAINENIEAINVSPIDRTVWVATQGGRLEGFDSNGVSISDVQTQLTNPVSSLNVGTSHAWIISQGELFIINREGLDDNQPTQAIELDQAALELSYDSTRDRVWVQLVDSLVAVDTTGQIQNSIDLTPDTISLSVYDRRLDNLWVISQNSDSDIISRYTHDGRLVSQTNTGSQHAWTSTSADSQGGLWLANSLEITHVTKASVIDFSLPAFVDLIDQQIIDIAAGSSDQSVWVANQTLLRQYSVAGELIHSINPDMGDGIIRNLNRIDLETELPATIPSIEIIAPEDGSIFNALNQVTLAINPTATNPATVTILDADTVLDTNCSFVSELFECSFADLSNGTHTLSITALAEDGTVSEPVSVTIDIDNIAPIITINSPEPNTEVSNAELNITGQISDSSSDANSLTLSINDNPVTLSADNQFTTTLTLLDGDNTITLIATDLAGNQTVQSITVTFNSNEAPVINSIPIENAQVGVQYQYDVDATDVDQDQLTYTLSQAPSGMVIDSVTGIINWLPESVGQEQVTVSVNDGNGASAEQSFQITVAPNNRPPSITSTPITIATADEDYTYNVIATDPDGDVLSYRLLDAPNGLQINATTGQITWTPFDLGFSSVSIEVADQGGLTDVQTYSVNVFFADDSQPPVLDPIGDIIAPLGQTTTRTIQATDPEGEAIVYQISPLPLPQGMNFEVSTGQFEYRPALADVGDRFFTISATDGRFTSSQIITVSVPEPTGETTFSGQVLFPDGSPLPGVRIVIGDQSSTSDVNGDFSVRNLPEAGRTMFFIDSDGVDPTLGTFASIPEQFDIVEGADNRLFAPIFLEPIDLASADPVDPFQESLIASSDVIVDGVNYGPVTITIAPETGIDDETGELFDGQIAISRIPDVNTGPTPMPDDIQLSVYISIQPFGVTYTEPAEASFPNIEGFEPGSVLDIFGLNHETGAFEFTGEARVSDDGKTIDSIGGVVFANSWHGVVAQEGTNEGAGNNPEDCECTKNPKEEASSSAGGSKGEYNDYHSLVPYNSLGRSRSLSLVYDSERANPTPILVHENTMSAPSPVTTSQRLIVGGREQDMVYSIPAPLNFVQGRGFTSVPVLQGLSFSAIDFETGIYPYTHILDCNFPLSRRSSNLESEVPIINYSDSPYGAGWGLGGISRLYENDDGTSVLMDNGDGNHYIYRINTDGETYSSPSSDYSVFERTNDGFRRTTKTGYIKVFDADGLLKQYIDRNQNTTSYIYDSDQRLIQVIDPVGLVTQLNYVGKLLKEIIDPADRITKLEHDAEGNLISIIDPDNSVKTYEYSSGNHIMRAKKDKRGFETKLTFDESNRFISAQLPDSSSRSLVSRNTMVMTDTLDGSGTEENPTPIGVAVEEARSLHRDANGNLVSTMFDDNNYVLEKIDGVNRITRTERDDDGNIMTLTRPNGSAVNSTYDEKGNLLTKIEDFNGATYRYTYDQFSLVTSKTDPLNRITLTDRDSRGNVIRTENAERHVTTYQYDERGLVTEIVDPNGLVITSEYNAEGLLEVITETPLSGNTRITTIQYNSFGIPQVVTTPDGVINTFEYDNLNRPTRIENQLGEAYVNVYDAHGNAVLKQALNIDGSIVAQESDTFDNRNRLIQSSMPHEEGTFSIISLKYDGNSNLVEVVDPDEKITRLFYDGEERVIKELQPDGGIVLYGYDTRDELTKIVAANGAVTTFEYDVLARRISENSPDRGVFSWEYNIVNQVTSQTDDRGIIKSYSYDLLDRPVFKTYPTTNENITYSYDDCDAGVGRLCDLNDESGAYTYDYDFFGNILSMTRTELGVTYSESYEYDDGNNILTHQYPTGRIVNFDRDLIRRISGISSNGTNIIDNVVYQGDSKMIGRSWENGIQENRQYDLQGRLTSISLGNVSDRVYSYDASSNILRLDKPIKNGVYKYDLNDRLIQESLGTSDQTNFDHDLNYNRLRLSGNENNEVYTYEENSNRLRQVDEVNQTKADAFNRTVTHNDADRIRSIQVDNGTTATYFYNEQGLRSRKEVIDQNGSLNVVVFHYDTGGTLIAETDDNGRVIKEYVVSDAEPIAQLESGVISYLHTDHQNTPRLGTDRVQQQVWMWESNAFGSLGPEVELIEMNLRFPGQYFDSESGLYYNWNRYYDPDTGRYITSDPSGLNGGLNTYNYAKSNPLKFIDPNGLVSVKDLTSKNSRASQNSPKGGGSSPTAGGGSSPAASSGLTITVPSQLPSGGPKPAPTSGGAGDRGEAFGNAACLTISAAIYALKKSKIEKRIKEFEDGLAPCVKGCSSVCGVFKRQVGNNSRYCLEGLFGASHVGSCPVPMAVPIYGHPRYSKTLCHDSPATGGGQCCG